MSALPSGTILLWHGSVATIPPGYLLCDGTNNTPDLRDRFLLGAGGAFIPGDTGGNSTHTHNFTGDGHSHTFKPGPHIKTGPTWDIRTTTNPATGTTDPTSNLPPYFSLAYIMKT